MPFFSIDANAVGSDEQIRNENGVILVDRNNTYEETEFYKDSLFGIAGGFHLVGLDTVDKKAHIHGNILANNFISEGDFGTRDLKEVSYLRNISGGGTINTVLFEVEELLRERIKSKRIHEFLHQDETGIRRKITTGI